MPRLWAFISFGEALKLINKIESRSYAGNKHINLIRSSFNNLSLQFITSLCQWFFTDICGSILLFAGSVAVKSTVSGTVSNLKTEKLLPGVNILVQSTTVGTTTGLDGSYEL